MMKKIIYTFLVTLLLGNSIFIANFLWTHYSGIPLFGELERGYNIGNALYQDEKYEGAMGTYETISQKYNKNFEVFHNLGNAQYKLGDLESAIESYEGALEIQTHPETQKNLEFVQSKIKQTQKEQQQDEEKNEEPGEDESQQESDENNTDGNSGNQNHQNSQQDGGQKLSEDTQAILEQRAEDLEQAQEEFKKYYNKNYKQDNSNSLLERIFNNSLLEQTGEKDW